jgi:signal transduction histidine kinase
VTQQPRASASAVEQLPRPAGLDPIRLQQFLMLQQSLLVAAVDPGALAEQLAQRVALFLGASGAALGTVESGRYRIIALYALERGYRTRYDGQTVADSEVGAALAAERPLLLDEPVDGNERRTLLVPFRTTELAGVLHVVTTNGAVLADEDLALARALALLVGAELANARHHGRLAQVARLKSDALTAMAHDLRAPLNALLGYASLLGDGSFGPVTTEQRDVCATLERQATELVDLLSTTLDVARLESGQFPLRVEEFRLADVMANLCAGTFARAARAGRLRSSLPADLPPLRTDRVKVKQIVQNLVDNALKHGGGSPVEVAAGVVPMSNTVRITVQDHGRGIAPDLLPHLFDPWRPGGTEGSGFGLYLVRSFTQALGGRVGASSAAGQGATVTVELPLNLAKSSPSRRGA